ncbi:uncharacterized protein LOC121385614 [Gigantopelta aegis]|uniref:uncharacterized protein LOC121385614 n=1 Tax=Gigantopelta aegis TaxID=1735272 RepID=UPI001B88BA0D|nr:uncharacterized protein LOC121385614 [Gigantopelta aegis]
MSDDTASCSSASGSQGLGEIIVTGDNISIQSDQELKNVVERFEASMTLDADRDIDSIGDSESTSNSVSKDGDSVGATSSTNSFKDDIEEIDDVNEEEEIKQPNGTTNTNGVEGATADDRSSHPKKVKKKKSPFSLLRRLTKFDKDKTKKERKAKDYASEFAKIRIDRLPQVFVCKYLGKRDTKGVYGLEHVRKPVDDMVDLVKKGLDVTGKVELPLVYLVVTPKGIDIREHALNKITGLVDYTTISIDFISYGVQDIKYWKVFTFIVVKELSSRTKTTECHAYLCDSSLSARKVALSLGAAFRLYSQKLQSEGKFHNFQVELRPPDELADAYKECDA